MGSRALYQGDVPSQRRPIDAEGLQRAKFPIGWPSCRLCRSCHFDACVLRGTTITAPPRAMQHEVMSMHGPDVYACARPAYVL